MSQNFNAANHLEDEDSVDFSSIFREHYPVIILIVLVSFLLSLAVTMLMDKKYTSAARVEPVRIGSGLTVTGQFGGEASSDSVSSNFVFTQSEVIKSNSVLKKVVKSLELEELWDLSEDIALVKLKNLLSIEPVYGTDLIEIKVSSAEASLSVDLIEEIILSYKKERILSVGDNAKNQLLGLKGQMELQEELRRKSKVDLDKIIKEKGIIYSEGGASLSNFIESQSYQQAEASFFELKKALSSKTSELEVLSSGKLVEDELLGVAAGFVSPGNLVARQFPEYQNLKKSYNGLLASGFGRKHPDVLALAKQIDDSNLQLHQAVKSLKGVLENEVDIILKDLANMQAIIDETRVTAVDRSIDLNDFNNARQDYEEADVMFKGIREKYNREVSQLAIAQEVIRVPEAPVEALKHSSPKEILNLGVGVVLGLVLGFMVAFLIEKLDNTIKTIDHVEQYLKTKVLAVIPKDIKIDLYSGVAEANDLEAYRILKTNIDLKRDKDKYVFSVCSAGPGEGKSTTMVNLANAYANSGFLTIIVDADMRRPSIHKKLNQPKSLGLSDYFSGSPLSDVVNKIENIDNLYLLPAGKRVSDPMHLLSSDMMAGLVADLRSRFDIVLIDSPPIMGLGDASLIANLVDETFLVIEYGKLPRKLLNHVSLKLKESGGSLLGVIINKIDAKKDAYYEYYTNYYNYYSAEEKEDENPENKKEKSQITINKDDELL